MASPSPDLTHFLSIPWCAALLSASHTTILPPPPNRVPKPTTEDALFAQTFKTPDTVSALQSFVTRHPGCALQDERVHTLATLGPALNGYANVAHGGAVAALIDEAMGTFLAVNQERGVLGKADLVTADLRVSFVRPVGTPQTVVVEVWMRDAKGRRVVVVAEMKDGEGGVLARGEAVWVAVRAAL